MWVKICGNTSLEDALVAVDAGADALGFVFASSPRQVTVAQTRAITARLPDGVEKYGVFVRATFEQILATVDAAGLSGVQIHATEDPLLATRIREHFSAVPGRKRLGLLRTLHYSSEPGVFATELAELMQDHSLDAALIDSRTAAAEGGTGLRFHWAQASGAVLRAAPHLRVIVAGGLAPDNVAEAIATLRPWGVDVVSGVEATPGRKDPAKVRSFIDRARATARALTAAAPRVS